MASKISKLIADAHEMYNVDRFDIELLLSHALKQSREWIVSNPDFFVPWPEDFKFQKMIKDRSRGVPVAYLTGHKEFFGFDFIVNKDTLVPRPDTEILVEDVLKEIESIQNEILLIDVGTGSGCIPISIFKTLKHKNFLAKIEVIATDISRKAIAIAKKNAHKHFVDITFFSGNLLEPLLDKKISFEQKKVIITANLPYLTQNQFDSEPSIQHEPHSALVAEDNGLALYKELLEQVKQITLPLTLYFEIDPSQTELLSHHIHSVYQQATIEVIKDLCGRERIVKIQK